LAKSILDGFKYCELSLDLKICTIYGDLKKGQQKKTIALDWSPIAIGSGGGI
jgi:hypothetical protein